MAILQYTGRQYIVTVPPVIIESALWKIGSKIKFQAIRVNKKNYVIMSEYKSIDQSVLDELDNSLRGI